MTYLDLIDADFFRHLVVGLIDENLADYKKIGRKINKLARSYKAISEEQEILWPTEKTSGLIVILARALGDFATNLIHAKFNVKGIADVVGYEPFDADELMIRAHSDIILDYAKKQIGLIDLMKEMLTDLSGEFTHEMMKATESGFLMDNSTYDDLSKVTEKEDDIFRALKKIKNDIEKTAKKVKLIEDDLDLL